jgi:hypothetical protein
MLIIALALAVVGLAALVFAVVTSNALVAWGCIGASALGVLLLTVDALRDRNRQRSGSAEPSDAAEPAPATPAIADSADVEEIQEKFDAGDRDESEPAEGGEEPGAGPAEPE